MCRASKSFTMTSRSKPPSGLMCDIKKNHERDKLKYKLPFSANGYLFTEMIGSGSFAIVFKVHHKGYNRDFAAKMILIENGKIDDESEAEINSLKRLNHPNIIKIYDYFIYQNYLVMILQLCSGTMKKVLVPNHGLGDLLESYMMQLMNAMLYSHTRQIAHRDLKTANVLIDSLDRPLLADFGLSHIMNSEGEAELNTFCGALLYRAPEVIAMKPHDPFKSDVWSLGVLFYVMATGTDPWPTYNAETIKQAILLGEYIPIPDTVCEDIKIIISKMLTVDPKQRPSIQELINEPYFSKDSCLLEEGDNSSRLTLNPQKNKHQKYIPLNFGINLPKCGSSIYRSANLLNFHTPNRRMSKIDGLTQKSIIIPGS